MKNCLRFITLDLLGLHPQQGQECGGNVRRNDAEASVSDFWVGHDAGRLLDRVLRGGVAREDEGRAIRIDPPRPTKWIAMSTGAGPR